MRLATVRLPEEALATLALFCDEEAESAMHHSAFYARRGQQRLAALHSHRESVWRTASAELGSSPITDRSPK